MKKKLEIIQYAGANWFIKKETKKKLTLIRSLNCFHTPIKIKCKINSPLLSLPLRTQTEKNKDHILGTPFKVPFDPEIIEDLTKEIKARKTFKYK